MDEDSAIELCLAALAGAISVFDALLQRYADPRQGRRYDKIADRY